MPNDDDAQFRGWHVAREVPIAVLLALLIQTAGVVWGAATMSAKIEQALEAIREFRQDRYTREDGVRDREVFYQFVRNVEKRDADIERRLQAVETRRHP